MKTQLQEYADEARLALRSARAFRDNPEIAHKCRDHARASLRAGKQFRNLKRQADMWGQLFDSFAGGRR